MLVDVVTSGKGRRGPGPEDIHIYIFIYLLFCLFSYLFIFVILLNKWRSSDDFGFVQEPLGVTTMTLEPWPIRRATCN